MDIALLTAFTITFAAVLVVPGPNAAFAVAQSLKYGARSTLAVSLGFMCATGVHAALVLTGLGAVLSSHPIILVALKWMGVAYLIHLAFLSFRNDPKKLKIVARRISKSKLFFSAMTVSLTNPKALLSSVMLYPLFIGPDKNYAEQALVISLLAMTISFGIYTSYIVIAAQFRERLSGSKLLNRVVGGIYVGAAGGLATR